MGRRICRLDPNRPPVDVPRHRWERFVDDVGRFLDDQWADKAAALGWGPLDLFGCDRDRPFARIGPCGLLGLLNGNKLNCVVREHGNDRDTLQSGRYYRRKPHEVGRVA